RATRARRERAAPSRRGASAGRTPPRAGSRAATYGGERRCGTRTRSWTRRTRRSCPTARARPHRSRVEEHSEPARKRPSAPPEPALRPVRRDLRHLPGAVALLHVPPERLVEEIGVPLEERPAKRAAQLKEAPELLGEHVGVPHGVPRLALEIVLVGAGLG